LFVLTVTIFIAIIVALVLILLLKKSTRNKKYIVTPNIDPYKISMKDIDKMEDGSGFELYLYKLFLCLGYDDAYKTTGSRDFGADLVFTDRDGYRNVIQAKRYAVGNSVGLSAVQEVFGSMRFYKARKSIVITSSRFTDPCETLAGINGVKLLNRNDLIEIIELFKNQQHDKVKDIIESEPRLILDSWDSYRNDNKVMKKDHKAARLVASGSSK
jgi:restriction system protein